MKRSANSKSPSLARVHARTLLAWQDRHDEAVAGWRGARARAAEAVAAATHAENALREIAESDAGKLADARLGVTQYEWARNLARSALTGSEGGEQ